MKKTLAFFVFVLINIPVFVFAKGGGYGSLMRERINMAYSEGYIAGCASVAASIVGNMFWIIIGIFIGAAGYAVVRRWQGK